ncbi:MAG: Spore coat protein SA [candidate division WS2 bacterium]|uniref:Spore coat protein SA n=1 Tax=Psychracetigena formicireducens TaxID=2986056 RepID=A0A9E2F1C5_PSYF1|nr:Spore coat protein SA [Candidatus Psychracetigena formicireducens]
MSNIKVAMLCSLPLTEIIYTGSKIYEDRLTYYLSHREDIELHIITIGEGSGQIKKDNLIIHTIKKGRIVSIPFFHPLLLWKIKCKTMEINPDIVHAISTGFFYSTVAAFLRDRYPVVLTAYGIVAKEREYYKEEYKKIYQHIFSVFHLINERYVLSKIPNIVVDSASIKNLISKWTESKIYVVPAGIEYDKIEEIQSHTLLNEKPDIFFVNNLQKLKGVDILIKAIPIVKRSTPHLIGYIAGTGPQEKELKLLVKKLNLEHHIKFLGFISDEEKYQYYKACKTVVVPSRWDCQPAALFDAAASGKPVIASDMSNPGIVEDGATGFIFESENVKDLADKIITLLKDEKLREEMGKSAKENVKRYDWSEVAETYVEIYKEAITDFHEQKTKK